MEREIERFEAQDDDGNIYTIVVLETIIDSTSTDSTGRQKIGGMKRAVLDDGSTVNVRGADTFSIFDSGKTLRRIR